MLETIGNPDAAWPSLLDFGVILWSFCIIILVILYYHSGHSVLSFWSFCIIHTGTVRGRTVCSCGATGDLWWAWSVGRTLGTEATRDLAPKAARHNPRCRQLVRVGAKFHSPFVFLFTSKNQNTKELINARNT